MTLEQRYEDPRINRQYWLADAMIRIKNYEWRLIDEVAADASEEDIAAFCRIVQALNTARNAERKSTK